MRSEIRSEIPQMDLHALSTIIPPTLRTFLPLWHNVLPMITLDCLISGEIERYTAKESVWFIYVIMWSYFQVWISLDHSKLGFGRGKQGFNWLSGKFFGFFGVFRSVWSVLISIWFWSRSLSATLGRYSKHANTYTNNYNRFIIMQDIYVSIL